MEERCRLVLEIDFSTFGIRLHVESSTNCRVMRDLLMTLTSTLQNPSVSSNHTLLILLHEIYFFWFSCAIHATASVEHRCIKSSNTWIRNKFSSAFRGNCFARQHQYKPGLDFTPWTELSRVWCSRGSGVKEDLYEIVQTHS